MKEKIGVGFIGTGFARSVQMPAFAACENARITSVASGSLENARASAELFNVGHFTDDWRETIERGDVDVVCITTPPNLHREMTLHALEHSKHVIAEKPMAMNAGEAAEMVAAAAKSSVIAIIDHELRFLPGRLKACEMIRNGEIGPVRHVKYLFRSAFRSDPQHKWNWWSDAAQGGGALGAINSHVIDSFRWLTGSEIESVSCQLNTGIKERTDSSGERRPVTTDDEANMLLSFTDTDLVKGATALVSVSMMEGPDYENTVEAHGEKGAIRIGSNGELSIALLGEKEWRKVAIRPAKEIDGMPNTGFARGFVELAPLFIDAVRRGDRTLENAATFDDGLAVQKVLDAARESDKTGNRIKLQ